MFRKFLINFVGLKVSGKEKGERTQICGEFTYLNYYM